MGKPPTLDPKLDFAIERLADAPPRLVWEALTKPEQIAVDQLVAHVLAMK
ncbi:SRPBCC family protein [Ramlibacter humi]|nr:hypothetical protein [Ramlibacter humi]